MSEQIWWYVARSGGIVAWALLALSVCWGLFVSTKAAQKASHPARLLELHRFLSTLGVVFTAVHIVGLVADNYVHFGWSEILVPWASEWQPTAVAWGVIGMYLLVAVELSSLAMKWLPRPMWRALHRLAFPLFVFATVHGIQAGTDTSNIWYQMAMLAAINVVAALTILTILAHAKKSPPRRAAAPAPAVPVSAQAKRPRTSRHDVYARPGSGSNHESVLR